MPAVFTIVVLMHLLLNSANPVLLQATGFFVLKSEPDLSMSHLNSPTHSAKEYYQEAIFSDPKFPSRDYLSPVQRS